ncbi:carbonic anhydrase [Patulibacter sp. NPDC049589]|uniref:carbonic anhydrase n=1 Tax=Patulibacter sp. NPDC049589 TaxID=3154731 RepID=UPI0034401FBB
MSSSWAPFGRAWGDEGAASPSSLARKPRRSLAVVTCMDARVDPLTGFGLTLGDAHVLRNAGAEATEDVLRSLQISHAAAGTGEVWLVGHTDCVAHGGDDRRVEASLRHAVERVARLDAGFRVRAFRFHLAGSRLEELHLG